MLGVLGWYLLMAIAYWAGNNTGLVGFKDFASGNIEKKSFEFSPRQPGY